MKEKKFEDLTQQKPEEDSLEDWNFKKSLVRMSVSDLHCLFIFVSGDFNKQFGGNIETKKIVHARYKMILAELNKRAYGGNPYEISKVEIKGTNPEDIDLSKFEEKSCQDCDCCEEEKE